MTMRIFYVLCCALGVALLCLGITGFDAANQPLPDVSSIDLQTVSFVDGVKLKPPAPPKFILVSSGAEGVEPADSATPENRDEQAAPAPAAPARTAPVKPVKPGDADGQPHSAGNIFPPSPEDLPPRSKQALSNKQQPSPSDRPPRRRKPTRVEAKPADPELADPGSGQPDQPDILLGPPPTGGTTEAAPEYVAPKRTPYKSTPYRSTPESRTPENLASERPAQAEQEPVLPPIEALSPTPAVTQTPAPAPPATPRPAPANPAIDSLQPHYVPPVSLTPVATPPVQVEVRPAPQGSTSPADNRWAPAAVAAPRGGGVDAADIEATVQRSSSSPAPDSDTQWQAPVEFTSDPAVVLPADAYQGAPQTIPGGSGPYVHQPEGAYATGGLSPTYEQFTGPCAQSSGLCWSAAVDVLALDRSSGPGMTLARRGGASLTGKQLDPGFEIGYRGRLMLDAGQQAWELVYQHQNWSTSALLNGPAGNMNVVDGVVDFTNATSVLAQSETTLNSIELNHYECHDTISPWLVGFRYLNLRDRLQINSGTAASRSDYHIRTSNNLFGLQLGRGLNYRSGRWQLNAGGKAGLYVNAASQRVRLHDNNNTLLRRSYGNSTASAAFLGEVDLTATYHVTSHCAVRGGYQLLWIEGVAEAPSQFLGGNPATKPSASLNTNDGLFAHGFYGGIEFNY